MKKELEIIRKLGLDDCDVEYIEHLMSKQRTSNKWKTQKYL